MGRILTDTEIDVLMADTRILAPDWRERFQPRKSRDGTDVSCAMSGYTAADRRYEIGVRRHATNLYDFCVRLSMFDKGEWYRMVRLEGPHLADHTNALEQGRPRFRRRYHVHKITERYQRSTFADDHYATPTDAFASWSSALDHLVADYGFAVDEVRGAGLFDATEGGAG